VLQGCAASLQEPRGLTAFDRDYQRDDDPTGKAAIEVRVYLKTDGRPLGAFDVRLTYVDEVGLVHDDTPPKPGADIQFFKWGRRHDDILRLEGFFSKAGPIEERQVHVATVVFYRHHAGSCKLAVEVVAAYDPQGKDIKSAVSAHANPPVLFFR
jgi:hypothetical protein